MEYGDHMHIECNICKATSFFSVTSLTKQDHLCTSRHFRSNPGLAEMTKIPGEFMEPEFFILVFSYGSII